MNSQEVDCLILFLNTPLVLNENSVFQKFIKNNVNQELSRMKQIFTEALSKEELMNDVVEMKYKMNLLSKLKKRFPDQATFILYKHRVEDFVKRLFSTKEI